MLPHALYTDQGGLLAGDRTAVVVRRWRELEALLDSPDVDALRQALDALPVALDETATAEDQTP